MGVVEPVRLGILSTAHINRLVIPMAHESERIELVAVASRDQSRADEYAREWGIEHAYSSYDALLADSDIEAVYISLPNSLHCEWSIRSVEAGKHVLCEKPMSRRASEVEEAFEAAERAQRILMEAFMYRHHPQITRLVQLVGEGAIGELKLVRSCFSYGLYDTENIRLRTDVEGGSLMDVGCYCVNASRMLCGEPERVFGEQVVGPTGTDWVFAALLRFPGDVLALFDCGTSLSDRDELEAIGSEGSLFLDDPWHATSPVIELRREDGVERIDFEAADPYLHELENFAGAIRGVAEPLLDREDAVAQARVIEALYRSAGTGDPVSL
jgi:xylose dehydrogenase (NAD/NADP)